MTPIDLDQAMRPLEIQPLRRKALPAEAYPINALGVKLTAAVKATQSVIQAPFALCAQSFLAGAAVGAQGVANLELHGSTLPLSEFFLTIAESGERKSAVDTVAKQPHNDWQREEYQHYEEAIKKYLDEKAIYDRERMAILNNKEGDKAEQLAALKEPIPPRVPLLFTEEPTFEGIYKQLYTGIPSIGIFSDEGGRMFGGHAMNAENRLKTIASFSKLWDGKFIDRVRAGDGASLLYNRRCSIHLMAQPGAAETFLNDGVSSDQGILSRFLIVRPESTKGTRLYNATDLRNSPALSAYNRTIDRLLRSCQWDRKTGELEFNVIRLSPDAMRLWTSYHDHIERQQTVDGAYRQITGLASKAAEHMARLAAIVQLTDDPNAKTLEVNYIEYAIQLMDYYLAEAIRIQQMAMESKDILEAEKLLEWFKAEKLRVIYPVKVYQLGPGSIRNKAKALPILRLLEDHGYLSPIAEDQAPVIDGAVRRQSWRIHAYSMDEVLR
jgi:hypothetical protein